MAKLYELTSELRAIQDRIFDSIDQETGEVEVDELTEAALDSIDMAFDSKVDGIARIVRSLMSTADCLKAEEVRLAKRRKAAEQNVAWLKAYVRGAMIEADKPKIKTPMFTVYLQTSAPPVLIEDGSVLPEEYLQPPKPREANKVALKKALKGGVDVPGARLGEPTRSLVIR